MCKKTFISIAIGILTVLIVILLLINFKIEIISGQSMAPTLRNGQITIVNKTVNNYQENDIIVFHTEDYGVCVKRIIATSGDEVKISNGNIYINNVEVPEYRGDEFENQQYNLKENEYFVVGDNSRASIDSRIYGPIENGDIIGKMIWY